MENEKIEIPTPMVNELVTKAVEEQLTRINANAEGMNAEEIQNALTEGKAQTGYSAGIPYWIDHTNDIGEKIQNILVDFGIPEGYIYSKKVGNHVEIGAVEIKEIQ